MLESPVLVKNYRKVLKMKLVSDMRYELERANAILPDDTPDDTIRALYQLYHMAISDSLPQYVKSSVEMIFSMTERGNIEAMDKLAEYQSLSNRGAVAWWDEMGIPADEMLDD